MNKILKKFLVIGLPLLGTGAVGAGIYVMLDNKSKPDDATLQSNPGMPTMNVQEEGHSDVQQVTIPGAPQTQTPWYEVFPKLSTYDFYKYLRIDNDGAYFTDDFIAAVVNKVVKDTIITDGELHWSYDRVSSTMLTVTFVWVRTNGDSYSKVYTFTLSN